MERFVRMAGSDGLVREEDGFYVVVGKENMVEILDDFQISARTK